jgi:hypothetical protein
MARAHRSRTVASTMNHHDRNITVRALLLRRYQLLRQGGDVAPGRSLVRRLVPSPAR